jgi:hypothetical protein
MVICLVEKVCDPNIRHIGGTLEQAPFFRAVAADNQLNGGIAKIPETFDNVMQPLLHTDVPRVNDQKGTFVHLVRGAKLSLRRGLHWIGAIREEN